MIELVPDCRTIGVLDQQCVLVGVIEVARAKALLRELADAPAIIVADLL